MSWLFSVCVACVCVSGFVSGHAVLKQFPCKRMPNSSIAHIHKLLINKQNKQLPMELSHIASCAAHKHKRTKHTCIRDTFFSCSFTCKTHWQWHSAGVFYRPEKTQKLICKKFMAEQNDIINNSRTMPNKATAKATKKKRETLWQRNRCGHFKVINVQPLACVMLLMRYANNVHCNIE